MRHISSTGGQLPLVSLEEVLARQYPTLEGFICRGCIHWLGGVGCSKNVFISMEGANMSDCFRFEKKED